MVFGILESEEFLKKKVHLPNTTYFVLLESRSTFNMLQLE